MNREQQLEEALIDVMTWIENWSPDFVYDAEWPDTHALVQTALAPQYGTNEEFMRRIAREEIIKVLQERADSK